MGWIQGLPWHSCIPLQQCSSSAVVLVPYKHRYLNPLRSPRHGWIPTGKGYPGGPSREQVKKRRTCLQEPLSPAEHGNPLSHSDSSSKSYFLCQRQLLLERGSHRALEWGEHPKQGGGVRGWRVTLVLGIQKSLQ